MLDADTHASQHEVIAPTLPTAASNVQGAGEKLGEIPNGELRDEPATCAGLCSCNSCPAGIQQRVGMCSCRTGSVRTPVAVRIVVAVASIAIHASSS